MISAHASVSGRCPAYPICPERDRRPLEEMNDTAKATGDGATIGIIAGAVLLATGITLVLTAPKAR